AAAPFVAGETITAEINGQSINLLGGVLGAAETLTTIVARINNHSGVTGVRAAIVGTGGNYNIELFFASEDAASAYVNVDAGLGFDASATIDANTSTILNSTTAANFGLDIVEQISLQGGADNGLGI